jgi:nucleoside-diphosphate-sugar epimerase
MRVLVTGSTGQVGRAIVEHLEANGHVVVGLSRRGFGMATEHVVADIADPEVVDLVTAATQPCETIVHAAASLDFSPDARSISATNCWGTQAVLAVARRWEVQRFVYISTVSVVGRPQETPVTESHPTRPILAYQASKLFGEHLVSVAADEGMTTASLRITAPVGSGTPPGRIISVFVKNALAGMPLVVAGKGTRRQNFVDVRDVAAAVDLCLNGTPTGILNVGGNRAISNVGLARTCVRVLDSGSEITFAGVDKEEGLVWDVSSSRARSVIGFAPKHDIESSIRVVASET